MTILIVEDKIRDCCDGRRGVSSVYRDAPDCVPMDIKLPRVDDIAATRAIRAIDLEAGIVIVTSYDVRLCGNQQRRPDTLGTC